MRPPILPKHPDETVVNALAKPSLTIAATQAGRVPHRTPASSLRVQTTTPDSPAVGEAWFQAGSLIYQDTASTTKKIALS